MGVYHTIDDPIIIDEEQSLRSHVITCQRPLWDAKETWKLEHGVVQFLRNSDIDTLDTFYGIVYDAWHVIAN